MNNKLSNIKPHTKTLFNELEGLELSESALSLIEKLKEFEMNREEIDTLQAYEILLLEAYFMKIVNVWFRA